jgi:transcriptional regulator with XRE-family HTH domain
MEYPMLEHALAFTRRKKYELAKALGISGPALSYKLAGQTPFTFDEQCKTAEFLGYKREYLFLTFTPPASQRLPKAERGGANAQ